jgi:hypothetical protein
MSADSTEFDDGTPADPLEADLVAYLDGELDDEALRRVEERLARDPGARARAAELKRAFDLLDYLPKSEPSPTFATRTLDRLPTASGSHTSRPAPASASTSLPVPLDDAPRPRWPHLLRAAALVAAVAVCGAVGFSVATALRPPAPHDRESEGAKADPDPRVIELLPLYAVADDLAFVHELAKPELFGDEPAVAFDPSLKVPPLADTADRPTNKEHEALARAYRALPPARQADVARLDAELHAREPGERDRLFRSLEAYAAWLDRLPDPDRRGVLAAATPRLRLGAVRDLRERQWADALPPPVRKRADALTSAREKAELLQHWKDDEAARRERWAFARRHAAGFAANRSPWPFDTDAGRKEVVEFARATFRTDDPKRCRLAPDELAEYRRTLTLAEREGTWAWFGLTVYELSTRHPYLPEASDPKLMPTDLGDLPEAARGLVKKGTRERLRAVVGRWPDFPLELHREAAFAKGAGAPLGPSRVGEFKEPVREFAQKVLLPKLTADERLALQKLEGRWPEFSREFVRVAARHDLAVPGVTLPGSPKRWDATYGARRSDVRTP